MLASRQASLCSTTAIITTSGTPFSFSQVKDRKYLYLSVCTGNLLALCIGFSLAWSSPVLPKLQSEEYLHENPFGRLITVEEASWIVSLVNFGAMFGTFAAGAAASRIGRKFGALVTCSMPFVAVYATLSHATNIYLYYCARLFAGFAMSGVYTIVPMYLVEISEDAIRGFICASIATFETFGELVVFSLGPYVPLFTLNTIIFGITALAAVVILVILPESPYYLAAANDRTGAEKSLMKLRANTKEGVRSELDFIQSVVQELGGQRGRISDIFISKSLRKAQAIVAGLTVFQHFSGVLPILMYSQSIFNETGSKIPPPICVILIGIVQFLSSFVTPNLVDVLGRRCMLLISAFGMLISNLCIGLYFFLKTNGRDVSVIFWLPVLCLVTFIIFYIMGFGPLIWIIMGELFPPSVKEIAFNLGVCFWWMMGFTVSKLFYPLSELIGMAGVFWMFAGSCFLSMFFILGCVFETKGKSLQEIQDILNK